jgi:hypothetical protein
VVTEKRILKTSSLTNRKKDVVVFDIDDTLCILAGSKPKEDCTKYVIVFQDETMKFTHFTFPHFEFLATYLLRNNVRIAVFSAAIEERNVLLTRDIFVDILGIKKYQKLVEKEQQFQVFSRNHQRSNSANKDLSIILNNDEKLENCVLIDDNTQCCQPGQEKNFILIPEIIGFQNYGYYFIGLFKSYVESKNYNKLSISQFMSEFIDVVNTGEVYNTCRQERNISIQFILDMVKSGLVEVRKTTPNAEIYHYDIFMNLVVKLMNNKNIEYNVVDLQTKKQIVCDEPFYLKSASQIRGELIRYCNFLIYIFFYHTTNFLLSPDSTTHIYGERVTTKL